jgi:hypothetical protein
MSLSRSRTACRWCRPGTRPRCARCRCAAVDRLVADHRRVRPASRVDPQVLERDVGGLALGQRLAFGLDDALAREYSATRTGPL